MQDEEIKAKSLCNIFDFFNIIVNKDTTQAELFYSIPKEFEFNSKILSTNDVTDYLNSKGIVYGLINENIEKILESLKSGERDIKRVLIAKGEIGYSGKDALVKWYVGPYSKCSKEEVRKSNKSINLKELIDHHQLVEGTVILEKLKPTLAKHTKKVTGEIIEFSDGEDSPLSAGVGIEIIENDEKVVYKSETEGILKVTEDKKVYIQEDLIIEGNVDYSTGNLHYFKDIVIHGNVLSGFEVESKGNIIIKGDIENKTKIISEKSIWIEGGALGAETEIRAGETITISYVHNAYVYSKNDIIIKRFVLGGLLNAGSSIEVYGDNLSADKASVIGAKLYADNSIVVDSVGTRLAARSYLYLCNAKTKTQKVREEMLDLKKKVKQITEQVKIDWNSPNLADNLENFDPEKYQIYDKIIHLYRQLNSQIDRKKQYIENIKSKLKRTSEIAFAKISKRLRPPVTVKIFDHKLNIMDIYENVKIKYNKEKKKVVILNS